MIGDLTRRWIIHADGCKPPMDGNRSDVDTKLIRNQELQKCSHIQSPISTPHFFYLFLCFCDFVLDKFERAIR